MLLTALGLALVVAAALFIAWPMLSAAEDATPDDAERTQGERGGPLGAFERRRDAALGALKEAEFDHQVGKLSDGDYAALRSELEGRALEALAALDAARAEATAGTAAAPAAGRAGGSFCAACGRRNASSQGFCAGCGKRLARAVERPRRRA
jgi:hypothetical protein